MKIFIGGESLAEQFRAAHRAFGVNDQASIGLLMKQCLGNPEYNQRINPTANDREHQRDQDRTANVSKETFHNSSQFEGDDNHINEFDSDERNDHSAQSINEQVALEDGQGADWLIGHAAQGQWNQSDDN